jgi:hypothetical protein
MLKCLHMTLIWDESLIGRNSMDCEICGEPATKGKSICSRHKCYAAHIYGDREYSRTTRTKPPQPISYRPVIFGAVGLIGFSVFIYFIMG